MKRSPKDIEIKVSGDPATGEVIANVTLRGLWIERWIERAIETEEKLTASDPLDEEDSCR